MPSPVLQSAKTTQTGTSVSISFLSPTTPGSLIILFIASKGNEVVFGDCTDNQTQAYWGNPTNSPNGAFDTTYDYGFFQVGGLNLQTQSYFLQSALAVTTLTVEVAGRFGVGGTVDMFVYEVAAPTLTLGHNIDGSNNTQLGSNQPDDPSATAAITAMFPGGGSGNIAVTFARGPNETVFLVCILNSQTFVSVTPGWTMDKQGSSAVAYRNSTTVTDPSGHITDGTFVLSGTDSFSMSGDTWYTSAPTASTSHLFKLNALSTSDNNEAINSTYCTYGFVNSAKAAQNPLLGFHRKRYSEIQMYIKGSGQEQTTLFPNYILKQDGVTFNPAAQSIPPIILQTDPSDDLVRPINISGNRVFVMYSTNAVGAAFNLSKTLMIGVLDGWNTVNPNV